jgi:group I intron endonuclease
VIGIYAIRNKLTGKLYVGQSRDITDRFARHKSQLKNNKHYNAHLQRSYSKHGGDSFEFIILENCSLQELSAREQFWIDSNLGRLYNDELNIEDKSGIANPFFGKKHTKATRRRMSDMKKGVFSGENNPNFGKHPNADQKKKMALNGPKTKLAEKDVISIQSMLIEGVKKDKEIAELFGVSAALVTRIANGTRWSSITGGKVINYERRGSYSSGTRKSEETKAKISLAKRRYHGDRI